MSRVMIRQKKLELNEPGQRRLLQFYDSFYVHCLKFKASTMSFIVTISTQQTKWGRCIKMML